MRIAPIASSLSQLIVLSSTLSIIACGNAADLPLPSGEGGGMTTVSGGSAGSGGGGLGAGASAGTGGSVPASGGSDAGSGGAAPDDGLPGPFFYTEYDEDGRFLIDALIVVTEQAEAEIIELGEAPLAFLTPHIDDINAALERSLVTSTRVRNLGVHVVTSDDYVRTGHSPADTLENIDFVPDWLSSYRGVYGADKIIFIAGSEESTSSAAWGGGDISSYWVGFLPVGHEFGHTMGGSHCNDGSDGSLQYGFPLSGYSAAGVPNEGPLSGGTMMCGNSAAFYSNPDLVLTLDQINAYVAEGVMPDQDYAAALGPGGTLRMGDEKFANMAQVWRNNQASAARKFPTVRYPGHEEIFYEKDDCVGFYGKEGYGQFEVEVCAGETHQSLTDSQITSVKVGRNVHVSLFSDAALGAGSTCGGIVQRLPFSSPSLEALSAHHETESLNGKVAAAMVYLPDDREAHRRFDSNFEFYESGATPFCSSIDGEALTLLRDGSTWSASAAVMKQVIQPPYSIEFETRSLHAADDNHADGMVVFFQKDKAGYELTPPPRETLGFIPDGSGFGVAFNIYNNQVSIRDGSFSALETINQDAYTAGDWVPIRVDVRSDSITVMFDGSEVLSATTAVGTGSGSLGFSAGSGAYSAEFSVRNVNVVPL